MNAYHATRGRRTALLAALALAAFALPAAAQDAPALGTRNGEMHPDILLPLVGGGHARLSDFRGKKVLLFNFASW